MSDPKYVTAIQAVAASQSEAELMSFLNGLYRLTKLSPGTRPTDWQVVIRLGPVTLHQPLEGGRAEFRPLPNRHVIPYRQQRWLLPLLRALRGRVLGRWAGRGSTHRT